MHCWPLSRTGSVRHAQRRSTRETARAQKKLQRRRRIVLLDDAVAVALAVPTTAELHTYMAKHAAAPVEQNSPSGYHLAAGVTAQPGCTRCSAGA